MNLIGCLAARITRPIFEIKASRTRSSAHKRAASFDDEADGEGSALRPSWM